MSNTMNPSLAPHNLGAAIERLRGRWGAIVAFGVLLMALGFASLVFAFASTIAMVTLNGVFFIIAGAAEIGVGMHAQGWGRFFLWVIGGIINMVFGILCILNPVFGSLALTFVLGAALIAAGVVRFYLAFQLPGGPNAHNGLRGRRGDLLSGFDHPDELAGEQPLCAGDPVGRRTLVPWRGLGFVWYRVARAQVISPLPLISGDFDDEMGLRFRR